MEISFCSLFCPSILGKSHSVFDFRGAEISNYRFEANRQINADALTGETDLFDRAVKRRLLFAGSNGFQRYRRIILLQGRG